MANVSVAAEWQLLYNRYYRKPEIYQMKWKHIDLSRNKVACAPFGGPIAVIRDDSKIVQLYGESALRKLRIFSSSGVLLSETVWKHPGGRLIGMSWTDDQTLVCIVRDGTVFRYNIHGELLEPNSPFSLGPEVFQQTVKECVFWGNGVVCVTMAGQLFCVPDFKNLTRTVKLADPGIEAVEDEEDEGFAGMRCVAVIEPQYTMSGNVEVLIGVGDGLISVDEDGLQPLAVGLVPGPLQKMVVSPNGKFLAMFTHDGRIVVANMDFSQIFIDYACESVLPPEQLVWCALDTVLAYWDDMLLMVGPNDDPIRYFYDEPIVLIPECDGVRILSNTCMEFLHRVPDSTVSIFKIGSTSPAALLYDALDHFDRRSAKADENLRLIRGSLPEAVEACVDGAGHEYNVSRQRTLLRAASYGQAFCSNFERNRIQEMCKTLRVLNFVRDHEIGIPLSIQQYKLLTASVLIGRLINSHHHLLALRISEYLGMNQEVVIMHWACSKITASLTIPDATLLEILLDKLKLCKAISYAAVAAHADKSGRRKLAAMLVEHEPRSSKQVPLLLSIGEEDTALIKATESGDTDLVYLVVFHIWHKRPALEFFGTIQARPLARDLFVSYARCYEHEFLKDFFLSIGQLHEVAFLLWKESWELGKNPMASRGSPLHGPRIKLIEKAQSLFSETKEHNFESKAAEEHAKLLRMQHELEVTTKQAIFVDSSISDTIRTCIVLGYNQAASKVQKEFKVSEKRWYWLKVFALATIRNWEALEKFSKEKRPPIGYRPFVEACIDADEKSEALKYIPKLADPRERAEAYARIGMAKEAADAASQAKDGELLGRLKLTFAQNAAASSIFDTLRDRLSFQGVT
ncbi:Vps16_C domain-containing protein/Vps16_N domain-containing protein [Cephalotus follicularis]|uniref:Protein VACUOLELESS1 n=1 Tax=Cephalotus follicularis TaxID=3775 RepID=A0A1Q3D730_CEPFO|nr:Vps16_C domain-containing protein/Vps16_N domain-containing protein [Cephalotus follicularis]